MKHFLLYYHAPRDIEKFSSPLPRALGHRKFSLSLDYQALSDIEKFPSPLPRAMGL
jgi:hypothetical protein